MRDNADMSKRPDDLSGQPPVGPGVVLNPSSGPAYNGPWYSRPGWPPARHRRAGTSLALGLIALLGALPLCGLTLFVAPFAWATGHRTLREIRQSGGYLAGEGDARAGLVLGIIGTVLLVLWLVVVVLIILWLPTFAAQLQTQPGGTPV